MYLINLKQPKIKNVYSGENCSHFSNERSDCVTLRYAFPCNKMDTRLSYMSSLKTRGVSRKKKIFKSNKNLKVNNENGWSCFSIPISAVESLWVKMSWIHVCTTGKRKATIDMRVWRFCVVRVCSGEKERKFTQLDYAN